MLAFAAPSPAQTLTPPKWKVGDIWYIETITDALQERDAKLEGATPRILWKFHVTSIEPIDKHDCYRIDIKCLGVGGLGKGRIRPDSTIWCDKETLCLRQLETDILVGGQFRKIVESYQPPTDGRVAVMPSINALPLDLPAFLPEGSKDLGPRYYKSAPTRAGSKDVGVLAFAHAVTQTTAKPGAKSLDGLSRILPEGAKALPGEMTEVQISSAKKTVTQLWSKEQPWPVYSNNGRTQSRLVAKPQGE